MLLRELVTHLGFDVDFGPLNKFDDKVNDTKDGLHDMGAAADEAVNQVKSALTNIRNVLIGFSVATAAGAAGLFAMVKSAANVGDEINKTAPLLGFSVEEFQKYRYAAKLAGVENENFAGSVQLLLRNVAEANNGNKEMIKSFGRAGINPAALKGLSSDQILRKLSDGLAAIPDQATRVSVSMDLLGRSGARMGMFLAKGTAEMDALMGDVEAFGMFTKESAQNAEDFNDALDRVLFFFGGIKNELQGLFPVFTNILNEFREWLNVHRDIIKAGLARGIEILTGVINRGWNLIKKVVHSFETMIKALGGVENAFWLLGVAIFSVLIPLIGPIILLTKATFFLLIPFIRLHTLITLVTFAMSALTPIITLLTSVIAALVATKIVGWLITLAGGYRALAAAIVIPTLAILAQAAAFTILFLAFHDFFVWLLGGKSLIGEWVGEWETVPGKLRKVWEEIKDVFRAGGDFIAAVFRGDFKEAFRLINEAHNAVVVRPMTAVGNAILDAAGVNGATPGPGPAGELRKGGAAFGGYAGGFSFAGAGSAAGAPSRGPGAANFAQSFRLGDVLDRKGDFRSGGAQVTQRIEKVDVNVNLPQGTPQAHAEETARALNDLLDRHIDHSLQQTVPPGG